MNAMPSSVVPPLHRQQPGGFIECSPCDWIVSQKILFVGYRRELTEERASWSAAIASRCHVLAEENFINASHWISWMKCTGFCLVCGNNWTGHLCGTKAAKAMCKHSCSVCNQEIQSATACWNNFSMGHIMWIKFHWKFFAHLTWVETSILDGAPCLRAGQDTQQQVRTRN